MSFKVGDVVKLKGGGPQMTITGTSVGPDRPTLFTCNWFDKDNREQSSAYPADSLIEASAARRPSSALPSVANKRRGSGWPS
jgi:uncharacterized protein YodC (DUF2158 family)